MSKTVIGIVILLLAVAGLGVYAVATSARGSVHEQPAASNSSINTQPAPDFSLDKLGGGTVTLAEYKGRKPVVLDFWATWCPNCQRDMPHLNAFYEKYKDKIEVIGIDLQEDPSIVQKFISDRNITFPIALDAQGVATQAFGVRYTNFHVLVDANGNVVKAIPGDIQESDFKLLLGS
ncbi:MAG: thiol-disulfide oxidoreductase [Parcubacteria group bacterium Greene0714_7]|nr:MAG: thiol-disulfide oxidoreductase [Parcubacteria group bacterium Greene0714_7]